MHRLDKVSELREKVQAWRRNGERIGFVPTMGALHAGHLSLVDRARECSDRVVVSIFVNPLQFGPNEDLDRYPRDLDGDARMLQEKGVDLLFFPSTETVYGENHQTRVHVSGLTKPMCGASRDGHFEGVTTVVCILLNQVQPDAAYFGLKDYQQFRVIEAMVNDLHLNVEIVGCPIIRESDGLALSSRNAYLSGDERRRATALYRALLETHESVQSGTLDTATLLSSLKSRVEPAVDRIDYLEIRDARTLEPIKKIQKKSLCAVAVFMGKTRLIDNIELVP